MAVTVAAPAAVSPLVQALNIQLQKYPQLDPRAVTAVASQEGLGGGIGDGGTSFGPFQLHYGGAYPSSAPQGEQASQAWATSPSGLDYALSRIASVAAGLKGQSAIDNIVTRFERPANPTREIQGASSAYGGLPQIAYTPSPLASATTAGRQAVAKAALPAAPAQPGRVALSGSALSALANYILGQK